MTIVRIEGTYVLYWWKPNDPHVRREEYTCLEEARINGESHDCAEIAEQWGKRLRLVWKWNRDRRQD